MHRNVCKVKQPHTTPSATLQNPSKCLHCRLFFPPPQFVTTRQLSENVQGEYMWVVGPPEAAGMSLGLTRRTEKTLVSGRIEVGGWADEGG